jgi:hypothetical protein
MDNGSIFGGITDVYGPSSITNYNIANPGSWTQVNTLPAAWSSITMSSSGQYMAACIKNTTNIGACGIYLSSNYGTTGSWNRVYDVSDNWQSITMSSSGQYIAACTFIGKATSTNGIYKSLDFGTSWSATNGGKELPWQSVSISSSGQYMAACLNGASSVTTGNLYIFKDFLTTGPISINTAINIPWYDVTISNTGTYINTCMYGSGGDSGSGIFTQTPPPSYGTSTFWNTSDSSSNWTSIASSSSGQYVVACTSSTSGTNTPIGIYLSTKYGSTSIVGVNDNTWYQVNPLAAAWSSIAMSSSGQYIAACINNTGTGASGIYLSSNYGATGSWRQINSTAAAWSSIAMSSTGQYIAACINNTTTGGIYLYKQNMNFGSMFSVIQPPPNILLYSSLFSYSGTYTTSNNNYLGYRLVVTITGPGTFISNYDYNVEVNLVGGGGGGGYGTIATTGYCYAGGGGAGGCFGYGTLLFRQNTSYNFTIGGGGLYGYTTRIATPGGATQIARDTEVLIKVEGGGAGGSVWNNRNVYDGGTGGNGGGGAGFFSASSGGGAGTGGSGSSLGNTMQIVPTYAGGAGLSAGYAAGGGAGAGAGGNFGNPYNSGAGPGNGGSGGNG